MSTTYVVVGISIQLFIVFQLVLHWKDHLSKDYSHYFPLIWRLSVNSAMCQQWCKNRQLAYGKFNLLARCKKLFWRVQVYLFSVNVVVRDVGPR